MTWSTKEPTEGGEMKKWWRYEMLSSIVSLVLLGSIALVIFLFINPQTCPSDYDQFLPYRGQCYRFSNGTASWEEARSACKNDGGSLLEIVSKAVDHSLMVVGEVLWGRTILEPVVS